MSDSYEPTHEEFAYNVAEHKMEVLKDDGVYRHLRFRAPNTGSQYFELITWPGHLCITGDMHTYAFSRVADMFEFFRQGNRINPGYWSEKLCHPSAPCMKFDRELFQDSLFELMGSCKSCRSEFNEALDLLDDFPEQTHSAHAFSIADNFQCSECDFEFDWIGETPHERFTYHFIWCCRAIVWGIEQYDRLRSHPDPSKSKCPECGFRAAYSEIWLLAPNPFATDEHDRLIGCPKCNEAIKPLGVCDERGCWKEAASTTPSDSGMLVRCIDHDIVLPEQPRAATYRTDIRGWIDIHGRYHGNTKSAEESARFASATHSRCKQCSKIISACVRCPRWRGIPRKWPGMVSFSGVIADE